jgi:hypothetical protein
MQNPTYTPGAIVSIFNGLYNHYAIVSDRFHQGKPMLISLSKRVGTVAEEPWDICVSTNKVGLAREQGLINPIVVLGNARSMIGKLQYNLLDQNCEHFVRWAHNLKRESKQLQFAALIFSGISLFYILRKR